MAKQTAEQWFDQLQQEQLDHLLKNHFGFYLLLLGDYGLETVKSSRVSKHCLATAKKRLGTAVMADYHALPFAAKGIDVCVLHHALEVKYPQVIIEEVAKILRDDGRLVITGYNPVRQLPSQLWHIDRQPDVTCLHSVSLLRELLAKYDLQIVKIRRFGFWQKFPRLEQLGRYVLPFFASGYVLQVQKQVTPLTPIAERWKKPRLALKKQRLPSFMQRREYDE